MRVTLTLLVVLFALCCKAQQTYLVKGTVTDSSNNQPLGFVSVVFNASNNHTATTNAFGHFEYKSNEPLTKVNFSFIGYNSKTITLNPKADNSQLKVKMLPSQYSLKNVTVNAGENPANRIVRAVIAHRNDNDPERIESYSYTAYNKFIYSGVPPANYNPDDKTLTGLYKYLEDHYFFILENVTETHFQKPEKKKEKIVAMKMSGLQDPSFTFLNTQVQPLGFYGNFISLLSNDYINPFTAGSTERYFFNIEDTLYSGKDTVYRISFRPWKGRKFEGLRGIAEINSDSYAIQHITAEPSDTVMHLMKVKVEQQYEKTDSGRWFPSKYVTEIRYDNALNNGLQLMVLGTTSLKEIRLNPVLDRKLFYGVQVEIMPDATYKSKEFWNSNRPDSLSEREQSTYRYLDSIGKRMKLDAKMKFIEGLVNGELRAGYTNIYLSRILWLNKYEDVRLGLGLRTNERVNKYISVGGFFGYGFRDKGWKYGGDLRVKLSDRNDTYLKFNYWKDLEESGGINFYKETQFFAGDLQHNFLVRLFDLTERYQVNFEGRALKYLHYDISAFNAHKYATQGYRFVKPINGELTEVSGFRHTGIKLALRYGFRQKMVQALRTTFFSETFYPVIFAQVTKGFKGALNGEYDYTRYEASIKYNFKTKSLGDFYLQTTGGYMEGRVPLGELFAGQGNYERIGVYAENNFQTMKLNEFYADKYVAFFYQQDLRTLLLRGRKFQPRPLLVFSALVGEMTHPEDHRHYDFIIPSKGYFETGLLINDIISKEYLGVARIGLGLGAFYRFGYYAYLKQINNFAFKASLDIRF